MKNRDYTADKARQDLAWTRERIEEAAKRVTEEEELDYILGKIRGVAGSRMGTVKPSTTVVIKFGSTVRALQRKGFRLERYFEEVWTVHIPSE